MIFLYILVLFFSCRVNALQNFYCQIPCDFYVESVTHTVCERAEQKCGPAPNCGPNFTVVDFSDDDRQYILDIHNYLRNKVALGYEKRNSQPRASNMRTMKYNHELEFIAQCWANSCNGNPLVHDKCRRTVKYDHVGQNLGYVYSTNPKINKVKLIKDLTVLWYEEVADFNNTWVNFHEKREHVVVGHYTQLIWAETTDIGCAMSYYTEYIANELFHQIVFVCNYGPGGNFIGKPVYKIGKPTSECPEDITRNSFYKGLCGLPEHAKEAANFTFDLFQLE